MRTAKRPLNPDAVKKANDAVGRPLSMSPEDAPARKKWMDEYLKAGGEAEQPTKPKPVGAPAEPCEPLVSETCAQLKKEMDELQETTDRFLMAADAYNTEENANPPPGYKRLNDQEVADLLGLDSAEQAKNMTHPDDSDFRAVVYQKDGKTVVSYRGTATMGDVKADLVQGSGFKSDHYERSKTLATAVNDNVATENLEFVGHSLGGGMAATAGIETGAKTTTFNAAGVHPTSVGGKDPFAHDDNITSHVVDGEALNWAQDNRSKVHGAVATGAAAKFGPLGGLIAAWATKGTMPKSAGTRKSIPAVWSDEEKSSWHHPLSARGFLHTCGKIQDGLDKMREDLEKEYKENGCEDELGSCSIQPVTATIDPPVQCR